MRTIHILAFIVISIAIVSSMAIADTQRESTFKNALDYYLKSNIMAETTHQTYLLLEERNEMLCGLSENLEKSGEFPFEKFWENPDTKVLQFQEIGFRDFFLSHALRQISGDKLFFNTAAKIINEPSDVTSANLLEKLKVDVDEETFLKLEKTVQAFDASSNLPQFELLSASLHKDDTTKQPFYIEGTLQREGDPINVFKIGYVIEFRDGTSFIGELDMPGQKSEFKIATSTQPVSIEFDPGFDLFRYIPKSDRENEKIRNESMRSVFDMMIVCKNGLCTTEEI